MYFTFSTAKMQSAVAILAGYLSNSGAVDAVLFCLLEAIRLSCLKGDPAAPVVGLGEAEVAVCAGNDDRLTDAGCGSQPGGRGGVPALDAEVHEEEAFLHDQKASKHRQHTDDLATFELALFGGFALTPALCH